MARVIYEIKKKIAIFSYKVGVCVIHELHGTYMSKYGSSYLNTDINEINKSRNVYSQEIT